MIPFVSALGLLLFVLPRLFLVTLLDVVFYYLSILLFLFIPTSANPGFFLQVSPTLPPLSPVHFMYSYYINLKSPKRTQHSEDFWSGHGMGNGSVVIVGSRASPFPSSQIQTFYSSQTVPLSFFKYIMPQFLFMWCLLTSGLLHHLCQLKIY